MAFTSQSNPLFKTRSRFDSHGFAARHGLRIPPDASAAYFLGWPLCCRRLGIGVTTAAFSFIHTRDAEVSTGGRSLKLIPHWRWPGL